MDMLHYAILQFAAWYIWELCSCWRGFNCIHWGNHGTM